MPRPLPLLVMSFLLGVFSTCVGKRPPPDTRPPYVPMVVDAGQVVDAGPWCPARYERTIFREDREWTSVETEFYRVPDCFAERAIRSRCMVETTGVPWAFTQCIDQLRREDAVLNGAIP